MNKQISISLLLLSITGCSVTGNDEFTCPNPEEGICMQAEDAYLLAEKGEDAQSIASKKNTEKASNEQDSSAKYKDYAPVVGVMSQPIAKPKPVLEPAQVLKVWINAWEDDNKVLHMPQTAYVEITPRRWNINDTKVHKYLDSSPFKKVVNSDPN